MKEGRREREARAQESMREVGRYMEEIRQVLPVVLRELREEAGLTPAVLSKLTGVKRQTVSDLEKGNRRAGILTCAGLALVVAGDLTTFCQRLDMARRQQRQ